MANRDLPKTKYSVVCTQFPMGSKFHLFQWEIHLSQFIILDKYLKFKEIKYFFNYINFEM